MKKFFYPVPPLFLFLLIIFSCNKDLSDDNTCGVRNPVEELEWLKNRINVMLISSQETAKYQYISTAEYRSETVFIFGNCDPTALSVFPVINCTNTRLGNLGEIPADSLVNQKVIWKTADSACIF